MNFQDRDDSRAGWDRIAPGYDRTNTPTQMWLGNEALGRAELGPGMRFLDVAAGSGALAIPAAAAARGCWRRTSRRRCSSCCGRGRGPRGSTSRPG